MLSLKGNLALKLKPVQFRHNDAYLNQVSLSLSENGHFGYWPGCDNFLETIKKQLILVIYILW